MLNKSELGSIYRVHAKIDLDAFRYNIEGIKACTSKDAVLMGVVKADAYGHGACMLAHELKDMGFQWFAVATMEEGIELRKSGIDLPILVLGYVCEAQYSEMIEWHITPTIYTYEMACAFDAAAQAKGKCVDIHIKIDTGMGRIGFLVNEKSLLEIEKIHALEHIRIQGMFTHFACADSEDKTHVMQQIEKFKYMIREMKKRNIDVELIHCSNSASIMEMNDIHMDMVRAGIILYGLYPSDEVDQSRLPLKPVMSLYSHIVCLKTLEPGSTVGYGATYITKKPTRVATIPIGYADGYSRNLSNKGWVLIRGKKAPIIGRVCMDQCMVDVSEISDAELGDVVTLIGRDGSEEISMECISGLAESFNYEFPCTLTRRIPRVYYRNGQPVSVLNYII